ncbi:hypothetical protein C9J85_08000 [Haloferax sp. wsp5]|nr:hypothetical protein C9J85_08000 [Haloferax sp. wsp5]
MGPWHGADTSCSRLRVTTRSRILATYDLEEDTVTLEDGVWTHIQRDAGSWHIQRFPLKTTRRPRGRPPGNRRTPPHRPVDSATHTEYCVRAPGRVRRWSNAGEGLSQEDARDDRARSAGHATVSRMLAQRTSSPRRQRLATTSSQRCVLTNSQLRAGSSPTKRR